jgi:hypothetical protein
LAQLLAISKSRVTVVGSGENINFSATRRLVVPTVKAFSAQASLTLGS